jgi:hypothetical protein
MQPLGCAKGADPQLRGGASERILAGGPEMGKEIPPSFADGVAEEELC